MVGIGDLRVASNVARRVVRPGESRYIEARCPWGTAAGPSGAGSRYPSSGCAMKGHTTPIFPFPRLPPSPSRVRLALCSRSRSYRAASAARAARTASRLIRSLPRSRASRRSSASSRNSISRSRSQSLWSIPIFQNCADLRWVEGEISAPPPPSRGFPQVGRNSLPRLRDTPRTHPQRDLPVRQRSWPQHGSQPGFDLSFRHGEVDGPDVSIRTASDTASRDKGVDCCALRIPVHGGHLHQTDVVWQEGKCGGRCGERL